MKTWYEWRCFDATNKPIGFVMWMASDPPTEEDTAEALERAQKALWTAGTVRIDDARVV